MNPAAARLQRLRWLLTALLVAVNTPALLLFAWLAVRADAAQEREQLDGDLRRVTLAALQLVDLNQPGDVDLSRVDTAAIAGRCPQFVVLPVGEQAFLGRASLVRCTDVDLATLDRAAAGAGGARGGGGAVVRGGARGAAGAPPPPPAARPPRGGSGSTGRLLRRRRSARSRSAGRAVPKMSRTPYPSWSVKALDLSPVR